MEENKQTEVVINEKSMEILVAKFIPTSQYFERSFEMLQRQLEEQKAEQKEFKISIERRFEQVDRRFEQVDEKITEFKKDVDRRFEQVDEKFEKVNTSINNLAIQIEKLAKSQETTIRDYIIERDRHYDAKFNNLRNYNVAIISVVAAVILKMVGIIHI